MLEAIVASLVRFLNTVDGWGIAVSLIFESAGAPFPSEVILPFAGFLVSEGRLGLFEAILYATLGQTAGSVLAYMIGLHGGRPLIRRYGRLLFLREHHLAAADRWFERYGERAVFFGRLLPVVRGVISYPAGVTRMDFKRYLAFSVLGIVPFTCALIIAGDLLGQNWPAVRTWFHELDYALAALAAAAVLWWAGRRLARGRGRPATRA